LPIVRLVRLSQSTNALDSILVTLSGIVTLATLMQPLNADTPMLVTGRLLIVLGMVTASAEPLYAVMVIEPLAVVYLNWPCAAGAANSRKASTKSNVLLIFMKGIETFLNKWNGCAKRLRETWRRLEKIQPFRRFEAASLAKGLNITGSVIMARTHYFPNANGCQ